MTSYRAGQRVRIEWPDHDGHPSVESTVQMRGADSKYACVAVAGRYYWLAEEPGTIVTVLSEPRPYEPTGLGAVVEAHLDVGTGPRRRWMRDFDGTWNEEFTSCPAKWAHLIDPVVISEGWTP